MASLLHIWKSSEVRSVLEATGRELGVTCVPSWGQRTGLSPAEPLLAVVSSPAGRPGFSSLPCPVALLSTRKPAREELISEILIVLSFFSALEMEPRSHMLRKCSALELHS